MLADQASSGIAFSFLSIFGYKIGASAPVYNVIAIEYLNSPKFAVAMPRLQTMYSARPLRGSRQHDVFPNGSTPQLKSLDSAFQLQEYLALLIREDPHDIERIVSLPKSTRAKEDATENPDEEGETVDENCWIYEHLRCAFSFF